MSAKSNFDWLTGETFQVVKTTKTSVWVKRLKAGCFPTKTAIERADFFYRFRL